MVLGAGAFRNSLDHEGGAFMNEFSALLKEAPGGSLTPSSVLRSPQPGFQNVWLAQEVQKISSEIQTPLGHWFLTKVARPTRRHFGKLWGYLCCHKNWGRLGLSAFHNQKEVKDDCHPAMKEAVPQRKIILSQICIGGKPVHHFLSFKPNSNKVFLPGLNINHIFSLHKPT